jgi:predicted PurR-regulated permease PerM
MDTGMNVSPRPPAGLGTARTQRIAIGVLAVSLVLLGLYTLQGFLGAIAWAGIFAVGLGPLYRRMAARFGTGRHNVLLPLGFTAAVALIFIVPLGLEGMQLAREAHNAADWLRDAQAHGIPEPDVLKRLPFGQTEMDAWWQQNLADPGGIRDLVDRLTRGHAIDISRRAGEQAARRLTGFVFTLLILFFMFRERASLSRQMNIAAVRLFGPAGERLLRQIVASVHGTVNGLVLVGFGQGVVLGVVYAFAGVPHPTVFGAFTAVAAMIPFGAPVIFSIAALLLLAKGAIAWGIAVFCIGFAVLFVADHFIRPVLIGGATQLPFIWVLLGILGGVEVWGLLGLFLGPAMMAAMILLWREWTDERTVDPAVLKADHPG